VRRELLGSSLTLPSFAAFTVHYWVAPATEKLMLDAEHTLKLVSTPEFRQKVPFSEIYQVTKLFDVYLARKIGALDSAKDVQVTSSSPGLCKSSLLDTMGPILSRCVLLFPALSSPSLSPSLNH